MEPFIGLFQGDSLYLQFVGKWGYKAWEKRQFIFMYIHLVFAALLPIYAGSHASLSCPPSAAAPTKAESGKGNEDDEDDLEIKPAIEGMQPSDAIMFPVLAGCVLAGLYYLIKWLEDPVLLNKLLNYYFSTIGVVAVGKFLTDFLNLSASLVAPSFRARIMKSTLFRCYIHLVVSVKSNIRYQSILGMSSGLLAIIAYNVIGKPWLLTNLIGWGFSYGTLQLMSPTTFFTGTLVLSGLFIYDIVMVFYTPLMVTVATTLEVPIKLVFPGPGRGSMLGLGDVVLPGIMIALALRFDLYLHYLRKSAPALSTSSSPAALTKAPYIEATGHWHLPQPFRTPRIISSLDGSHFPKIYFNAAMTGYVVGMLATLVVLQIFNHAQPALLYLVPGVLGALWGTALFRGELALLWEYTEDGSLLEDDNKKGSANADDNVKDGNSSEASTSIKDTKKDCSVGEKKNDEDESAYYFHISLSRPKA